MIDDIKKYYELFLRKLYNQDSSYLDDKIFEVFLKKLKSKGINIESRDDWFAWWYLSFQFAYWSEKKTRFDGKIYSNWILGDLAIIRWLNKSEDWSYFTQQFLSKYEIEKKVEYYQGKNLKSLYENIRKEKLNTEEGFFQCQLDSVYSSKSVSCIVCRYKKECMNGCL